MIIFSLNKETYRLRNLYSELTIEDAERIAEIPISEEELKEILITDDIVMPKHLYKSIRLFLSVLSDAPLKELNKVDDLDIAVLFDGMPKAIVSSIFYRDFSNWRSFGLSEIEYKGRKWTLPDSITIEGEEILCYRENCQTVLYAADMLQALRETREGGFSKLALICALLLREPGDRSYSDEGTAERAILFKELPLDIALEAFFFFKQYCTQLGLDFLSSSLEDLEREGLGLSGYLRRLRHQLSSLWRRLVIRLSGRSRRSSNTLQREQRKQRGRERKGLKNRPPLLFVLLVAPVVYIYELIKKKIRG